MKTTSVDLFNSIMPGVVSKRLANNEIEFISTENLEANVHHLLQTDPIFQSYLDYFEINLIKPILVFNALSHSSFINEYRTSLGENAPDCFCSYERLELLGDSVLELIITEKLFRDFPSLNEGVLSKLRGQFVSKVEISKLAKIIGLSHFVMLGRGEYLQKIYEKDSILADIFESVLGAVYETYGLEKSKEYLNKIFSRYQEVEGEQFISVARVEGKNFKGRLQELLMKSRKCLPRYTDIELDSGEFLVTVASEDKILGKSINKSKKQAQINAAKIALSKLTQ